MDRTIVVFFCATVLGFLALAFAGDLGGGRKTMNEQDIAPRRGAVLLLRAGDGAVERAAVREPRSCPEAGAVVAIYGTHPAGDCLRRPDLPPPDDTPITKASRAGAVSAAR